MTAANNATLERLMTLGVDPLNPGEGKRLAVRHRQLRALVARHDPNVFCRFVLKDERTGKPILQAPMHKRWHELMGAHDRLVMWSHVEGGKTTQVAIGRTLFELGADPNLRVAIVSNTNELAKKMTRLIGQYIEKSAELHEVFPELVPTNDPNLPWKASQLTVRREHAAKDPSVQACGVHGNIIGSRIDLLILDDILDHENTHTPGPRADVIRWIKSSLFSRLTEKARVWIVGNAWHPEDAMHLLEKEERFVGVRFPVVSETGELTWPERWSKERIDLARQDLGPLEHARQLMCQARDDSSARFKREWIDVAIENGRGLAMVRNAEDLWDEEELSEEEREERAKARETIWRLTGKGAFFTGVDLAVSKSDSAGSTVLFTIYVDEKKRRRVLDVRAGKWSGPEIVQQIKQCYDDFGSIFIIENNAMQQMVVDMIRDESDIPVVPFTTGKNKAHYEFGVESLAAEMAGGKWVIPNKAPTEKGKLATLDKEVSEWISEMLFYDPKEHTGDRLMASWFAREGARKFVDLRGGHNVGVRVL
jgi:hypothetical protein